MSTPDTEHDKLVRLEAVIGNRLRDGHVNIGDLLEWWTRILGGNLDDIGWKVSKPTRKDGIVKRRVSNENSSV